MCEVQVADRRISSKHCRIYCEVVSGHLGGTEVRRPLLLVLLVVAVVVVYFWLVVPARVVAVGVGAVDAVASARPRLPELSLLLPLIAAAATLVVFIGSGA